MNCLLCESSEFGSCYHPPTLFNSKYFYYHQCRACKTVNIYPLPNEEDLQKMYSFEQYHSKYYAGSDHVSDSQDKAISVLRKYIPSGKVLDYGCGSGFFLRQLKSHGYETYGCDLSSVVTHEECNRDTRFIANTVIFRGQFDSFFDIIYLGDVLEHLTSPFSVMESLSKLLKPNGYLYIEGPLENNFTLVHLAIKLYKSLQKKITSNLVSSHPPYHVTMMTYRGFIFFLKRLFLEIEELNIYENDWPVAIDFSNLTLKKLTKSSIASLSGGLSRSALGRHFKCGNRAYAVVRRRA